MILSILFLLNQTFAEPTVPAGHTISAKCKKFMNWLETQDSTEYGWVVNRNVKDFPVYIFYYGRTIRKNNRVQNPVLFLNGGPGASGHRTLSTFENFLTTNLTTSFLTFDQRGTGCSTKYPNFKNVSPAFLKIFDSKDIVNDAELLRSQLNIHKWKIFGQSYGGLIVQRYLIEFPDSISAAIAHGTPIGDWRSSQRKRNKRIEEASQIYFENHPEYLNVINRLKSAISDSFCLENEIVEICGAAIFDLFYKYPVYSSWAKSFEKIIKFLEVYSNEPERIVTENTDDKKSFTQFMKRVFKAFVGDSQSYYWNQVLTHQEFSPGNSDYDIGHLADVNSDAPFSEGRLYRSMRFKNESFRKVGIDPVRPDEVISTIRRQTDLKFFVFGSINDPISPGEVIESQAEQMRQFSNFTFYRSDQYGHRGYFQDKRILELLASDP